ncbi:Rz1-like lysis system protein LysC [Pseudomonas rhizoryzae]|uniref:Rz1-like lysis system protein LysC n=1 Tax=Pseudomonas rhizoryzae TaxID=2571129 RepID=UPI0018774216|nr:Rz1-like lysis system protein LysC [Pseudomonas rhizoryzae]
MKTAISRPGLLSLCLLQLAGCASAPPSTVPALTVTGCPLVTPCQLPATAPRSNGELLADADTLEAAWADCAAQVDQIYTLQQAQHEQTR